MYSLVKLVHTYKIVKRNFTLDENGIVYKTLLHPFLLPAYDKSCLVPVLFLSGDTTSLPWWFVTKLLFKPRQFFCQQLPDF